MGRGPKTALGVGCMLQYYWQQAVGIMDMNVMKAASFPLAWHIG